MTPVSSLSQCVPYMYMYHSVPRWKVERVEGGGWRVEGGEWRGRGREGGRASLSSGCGWLWWEWDQQQLFPADCVGFAAHNSPILFYLLSPAHQLNH